MKAAVLVGFGGLDQLVVREVPEPTAGAGEVKVRVVATSINPVDSKIREGVKRLTANLQLPAILGRDVAGEVIELGPGTTRLRVGSKVVGLVSHSYAERVVAKEEEWALVPSSMDLIDAAALPLVALTGAQLIDEGLRPHPGELVLVTGAVGSVGRVAVYTAKARGAKVWAGVRSSQRSAAAELGVDGILALDDAVIEESPMFDTLADTVGGKASERVFDRVQRGGVLATVIPETDGARERGLEVRNVRVHSDPGRLTELMRAVAAGTLTIPIAKRFRLSEIREAQDAAQKGAGGKVLVLM